MNFTPYSGDNLSWFVIIFFKKALCKQLEVIYADDMKFMSDLAGPVLIKNSAYQNRIKERLEQHRNKGRYLRVQENFHQGIVTAECYGGKFTIFVQPDLVCGRLSWGRQLKQYPVLLDQRPVTTDVLIQ